MRASVLYAVLSSGSIGNSYVFTDGVATIMIDAGLSMRQTVLRLSNINMTPSAINGIFLTHLHPDHAKTAKRLSVEYGIPVHINEVSLVEDIKTAMKYELFNKYLCPFTLDEEVHILNRFIVSPFELHHDAPGTVGYKITHIPSGKVFTLITDTGFVDGEAQEAADDADVLLLEANYDVFMLNEGPYPKFLRDRIRSKHGHLSNDDAFEVLNKCSDNPYRKVIFIHMSDNNNCYDAVDVGMDIVESAKYSSAYILNRGEFFSDVI